VLARRGGAKMFNNILDVIEPETWVERAAIQGCFQFQSAPGGVRG
jgi:hypothetical protein